jgi:hypothetical protein
LLHGEKKRSVEKIILSNRKKHRIFNPKQQKEISEKYLKYSDAINLASDIDFNKSSRFHVIINGTFYFGDFIEAFITSRNIHVKKLTISTLSMNQNNVDSLENLITKDFVDELNLLVSDYFYSHERHQLIPYIYEKLDIDNKFQLSVAGTHCKIALIETHANRFYVFHGSANLRSSSNIEQVCLEENKSLYLWHDSIINNIVEEYKTINKSIRGNKLWQVVKAEAKTEKAQNKQEQQDEEKC